jgi:altronate dehydratase small subunit
MRARDLIIQVRGVGARARDGKSSGGLANALPDTDRRLLLLDAADNVLVATSRILAGETVLVEDARVMIRADLPIGHKLSRRAIAAGEKIIKYGAPIGSATADIAAGAHVHVHNVRSDYTPTYHLEDIRTEYGSGA